MSGRHAINLFTPNHGCEATVQHELHPQMQLPQQGDEWWIEDATKQGFVILPGDVAIFRTTTKRETVERTGARIIGYARADYTAWEMLGGLISHCVESSISSASPDRGYSRSTQEPWHQCFCSPHRLNNH